MGAPVKFYYDFLSQPSRALYIFMRLAKIPFEENPIALRKGKIHTCSFFLNPIELSRRINSVLHLFRCSFDWRVSWQGESVQESSSNCWQWFSVVGKCRYLSLFGPAQQNRRSMVSEKWPSASTNRWILGVATLSHPSNVCTILYAELHEATNRWTITGRCSNRCIGRNSNESNIGYDWKSMAQAGMLHFGHQSIVVRHILAACEIEQPSRNENSVKSNWKQITANYH